MTQEILLTGPQGFFEMILFFLVFEAIASVEMSAKSGLKNGGYTHQGVMRNSGDVGICYVSCTCDGGDVWVLRVHVTLPIASSQGMLLLDRP